MYGIICPTSRMALTKDVLWGIVNETEVTQGGITLKPTLNLRCKETEH